MTEVGGRINPFTTLFNGERREVGIQEQVAFRVGLFAVESDNGPILGTGMNFKARSKGVGTENTRGWMTSRR